MTPNYLLASGIVLGLAAPGLAFGQAEGLQPRHGQDFELNRMTPSGADFRLRNVALNSGLALGTTGHASQPAGRVGLGLQLAPRHELRLLYVAFEVDEMGTSPHPVFFQQRAYAVGPPIEPVYRFDSYRLGWRYTMLENAQWTWKLGATTRVRSAEMSFRPGDVMESRRDTARLPLLTVHGEYRFAPRWRGILDFEGLAGGGRAMDLGLRVSYDMTQSWAIGAGYRLLDPGVENANFYNFARFNSLGINARYRW
jgi:hypothetical protein